MLSREGRCVQRASVDEAYVDLTAEVDARLAGSVQADQLANTHVLGWSDSTDKSGEPLSISRLIAGAHHLTQQNIARKFCSAQNLTELHD